MNKISYCTLFAIRILETHTNTQLVYSCTGSTACACRNSVTPSVHHGGWPFFRRSSPLSAHCSYLKQHWHQGCLHAWNRNEKQARNGQLHAEWRCSRHNQLWWHDIASWRLYCCSSSSLLTVCRTQQHHQGCPHIWKQLQKGPKLSKKITSDVDIQDQDNNIQSNSNTSPPDTPLVFLAAAPLARPSFANNSLNGGIKSKDACGQGKCTLREMGKKSANSSLPKNTADMEAMSVPALSHIKLLNHNNGDQNQQQTQQSIPFIKILDIITGKVPFPHPNTSSTKHTLVMDEEHLKANNFTRLSTPAAVDPSTCSDHSNARSNDGTTKGGGGEAWTAVSPKTSGQRKQQSTAQPLRPRTGPQIHLLKGTTILNQCPKESPLDYQQIHMPHQSLQQKFQP